MQTLGAYPMVRMRRMRHDDFSRRLMRENVVTPERPDPSGLRDGRQGSP